jgi:energy-coupling factor transporter ATP-binding protein EcfA2
VPPFRQRVLIGRSPASPDQVYAGIGDLTFGVADFKSIATAALAPRRLTVLTGANSSGKSSLLQALLFFAQSFGEPSVVINGDLVRLGEGSDVIRDQADSVTLELRYSADEVDEPAQGMANNRALHLTLDSPSVRSGLVASAMSLWVDGVCLLDVVRTDVPAGIQLVPGEQLLGTKSSDADSDIFVVIAGVTPTRLAYRITTQALSKLVYGTLERTGRGRLNMLSIIISQCEAPSELVALNVLRDRFAADEIIPESDPQLQLIFDRVAEFIAPDGWMTTPIALTLGVVHSFGGFRFAQSDYLPERPHQVVSEIADALDRAQRLAAATTYLGPLRDDPRVAYPLGHTVGGLPVGEKGEFTAAYLLDNATERIAFSGPDGRTRSGSLAEAVKEWCHYLGIADEIKVDPMGKLGHQLLLEVAGHLRDPTAVGVGASQLLPVVALVLGAPSQALILLEQPELHLHPKVQSRLADFFVLARSDVRLVIETHSEYLLTRLRVRIAQGTLAPNDVAVLFASQQPVSDDAELSRYTEFRDLTLDELGDFDLWPVNFFDSLDDDAVALAEAVAARVTKGKLST